MEYVWNGSYGLPLQATFADNVLENDFDLDLHQIWEESDLPAPPPCLATEFDETKPESSHAEKTMAHRAQDPIVECLFYSNTKSNHAFRGWGRAHCFSRQSPRISSSTFQPSCQRK
ncbi:uncharacterized protein N7483_002498 [Penicillium malachiteum]|uniref:uncharacterized protein n=1 Tax=Penicillium malachiteum TaxID=1324776 RepID=UPI00254755FD|nr:uncharacterized protein N7483_002498 [Penicillium malachiteum]KAJ5737373.1 hypothetical protein N7483_002498 [Penicillium malachiteum]